MNEEEINLNKQFLESVRTGDYHTARTLLTGKKFINGIDAKIELPFKASLSFAADEAYYTACELGHLELVKYFMTGEFNIDGKIIQDDIKLINFKINESHLGLISAYEAKQKDIVNYLVFFAQGEIDVVTLIRYGSHEDVVSYYKKNPSSSPQLTSLIISYKKYELYESFVLKDKMYENVLFDDITPEAVVNFLKELSHGKAVEFIDLFKDKFTEKQLSAIFICMCKSDNLKAIKLIDKLPESEYKNGIIPLLHNGTVETLRYVLDNVKTSIKNMSLLSLALSERSTEYANEAISLLFTKGYTLGPIEIKGHIESGTFKEMIDKNGLGIVNIKDYDTILSGLLEKESNTSKALDFCSMFKARLKVSHLEKLINSYLCSSTLTYPNLDELITEYTKEIKELFQTKEEISNAMIYFYRKERFDKLYKLFGDNVLAKKAFLSDDNSAKKFFKSFHNINDWGDRQKLRKEFLLNKKEIEDRLEADHLVSALRTNLPEKAEKSKAIKI